MAWRIRYSSLSNHWWRRRWYWSCKEAMNRHTRTRSINTSCIMSSSGITSAADDQGMEEIVLSKVHDEEDAILTASTYVLFPCLDDIRLDGLDNLKHIGDVLAKRTTNVIHDQFMLGVIPYYPATQMHNVQNLTVVSCGSLVGVFVSEEINNINDCTITNFKQGSLPLPRQRADLRVSDGGPVPTVRRS